MSAAGFAVALAVAFFAFGALMIALFGGHAAGPSGMRELWRAFGTTIIIAAAVLVPAALHPAVFSLVVAGAAWRCMHELAALHGQSGYGAPGWLGAAAAGGAAVCWGANSHGSAAFPVLMAVSAAAIVLAVPACRQAMRGTVKGWRFWTLVLAFPLLAAAHLAQIVYGQEGFLWIFLLYATVEAQDSFAYLFGRLFGRRKLLPGLSPGKTVTGALMGALFGVLAGALIAYGLLDQAPARALAFALVITAAGFAGDLFTSALKRGAGAKDFARVHALHGGLLDIYDSTLFAAIPLSATLGALRAF